MRSVVEWALAVAALLAVVGMGVPVLMRWLPAVSAPSAVDEPDAIPLPEGVPESAQATPLLLLLDGTAIRVGDTATRVHRIATERRALAPARVFGGAFGQKVVRGYQVQGTRFWLVIEATAPAGEARVTGIYLP